MYVASCHPLPPGTSSEFSLKLQVAIVQGFVDPIQEANSKDMCYSMYMHSTIDWRTNKHNIVFHQAHVKQKSCQVTHLIECITESPELEACHKSRRDQDTRVEKLPCDIPHQYWIP